MNETTSPSSSPPSEWLATNRMNASGSLTAGGGTPLPRLGACRFLASPGASGVSTSAVASEMARRTRAGRAVVAGAASIRLAGRLARVALAGAAATFAVAALVAFVSFAALRRPAGTAAVSFAAFATPFAFGAALAAALRGAAWAPSACRPRRVRSGSPFSLVDSFFLRAGLPPVVSFWAASLALSDAFSAARSALSRAFATSAALRGGVSSSAGASTFSLVALRLLAPRTGRRGVKIQPTPGTGFPPIRRPGSKSQGCSPWNSWNESLESTTAPVRSAMRSTKASPRPMAPAGGDTTSPCSSACSSWSRSLASIRCAKEASTTTTGSARGSSSR